ncbi:PLD nuclease N-terminal domain-containing protein [Rothia halotolerans]|uniref:PLD nuclease N-terminal domain-containing protein n=1 Tax=Rothia halotolerans TaxID=405770 RepID=UPI00101C5629|nr:PLD nuclease N-terminal domain-containing protein [Rothia halotolerans]
MNFTTPDILLLIGFGLVAAAAIALFVGALISVMISERYTGAGKILWALAIFAFPFLGPVTWFLVGRTHRLEVDQPAPGWAAEDRGPGIGRRYSAASGA